MNDEHRVVVSEEQLREVIANFKLSHWTE